MKALANTLVILAALGLLTGLVVRLVKSSQGVLQPAWSDPVFFWRGAVALLLLAIAILAIQVRDK